jgi:hypothetical protein
MHKIQLARIRELVESERYLETARLHLKRPEAPVCRKKIAKLRRALAGFHSHRVSKIPEDGSVYAKPKTSAGKGLWFVRQLGPEASEIELDFGARRDGQPIAGSEGRQ